MCLTIYSRVNLIDSSTEINYIEKEETQNMNRKNDDELVDHRVYNVHILSVSPKRS